MNYRLLVGVIALGLAVGCSVGPNYERPEANMPDRYGPATQPSAQAVELRRWWTTFDDRTLDSLIIRATESNLDLRLSAARIRKARAARGIVTSDFFPIVDVNGSYSRDSRSLNTFNSGGGSGGLGGFGPRESDLYQAGFDATWEIDVFGGVRRSVEAADADIQAAIEGHRDVLVTLLGDVARNYVELRGSQRRLAITRANLTSQRDALDVTQARFNAGIVGELDVARGKALTETTAAQIPAIQSAVEQSAHRLAVLLGQEPSALMEELGPEGPIPTGASELPVDLPSELLRRRPDIRRAERELAAQTARIGVATADLFPRFSLTGSFGLQSDDASDFAESDSLFWNVGPGVRWNVFNAGRFRSNIEVQNAIQEQALITYQQTILNSLEEVQNAMVSFRQEQARRVSLSAAVDANRRAVQLASDLYARGLTDFLSVQQAQRDLLGAEDQLAQSESAVSSSLVRIYKALGGGWESFEEEDGATQESN